MTSWKPITRVLVAHDPFNSVYLHKLALGRKAHPFSSLFLPCSKRWLAHSDFLQEFTTFTTIASTLNSRILNSGHILPCPSSLPHLQASSASSLTIFPSLCARLKSQFVASGTTDSESSITRKHYLRAGTPPIQASSRFPGAEWPCGSNLCFPEFQPCVVLLHCSSFPRATSPGTRTCPKSFANVSAFFRLPEVFLRFSDTASHSHLACPIHSSPFPKTLRNSPHSNQASIVVCAPAVCSTRYATCPEIVYWFLPLQIVIPCFFCDCL